MIIIEKGMTVTLNYVARLDDGKIVDSTLGGPAQEFVVGNGETLVGFERAILGMKSGDTKTVRLNPEDCYGQRQPELVVALPKSEIPKQLDLRVGQIVNVAEQGRPKILARVEAIGSSNVTLDANHPLAGKSLTYEIAILEVTPP